MAINEYYIDTAGGNDTTGDGSIGTPWATLYHAFANSSLGTEGIRFWLYGTDVLSAALPTSVGGPGYSTTRTPIRIKGWDKLAAGNPYPGVIDASTPCAAGQSFIAGGIANSRIVVDDLELKNAVLWSGAYTLINACYLSSTSSSVYSRFYLSNQSVVINSHIEPATANCIGTNTVVENCFFDDANLNQLSASSATLVNFGSCVFKRNIFKCDGNNTAILCGAASVSHNSVLCTTGTATRTAILSGTQPTSNSAFYTPNIVNNIVEGFGTQKAFELGDRYSATVFAGNAAYNNGTDYDTDSTHATGDLFVSILQDNESLGSSPFAKSGALTFANRFVYFKPNNVGNVHGGAYNGFSKLDKGAVQDSSGGGGGGGGGSGSDMLVHPGMSGGMRG